MWNKNNDTQYKPNNMSTVHRPRRSARGVAYTEVLLSGIILSVLIVSALQLFANLGRSQQNTLDEELMNQLASQMIEEIKVLPYRDPTAENEHGPGTDETGTSRSAFDDIDDYDGWSAQPPQDKQGNPISRHPDIIRSVTVIKIASNNFNQQVADDEGYKKVIVKISRHEQANVILQREYVMADAYLISGQPPTTPAATTESGGTKSEKF